jgi:hypothetical protein
MRHLPIRLDQPISAQEERDVDDGSDNSNPQENLKPARDVFPAVSRIALRVRFGMDDFVRHDRILEPIPAGVKIELSICRKDLRWIILLP